VRPIAYMGGICLWGFFFSSCLSLFSFLFCVMYAEFVTC